MQKLKKLPPIQEINSLSPDIEALIFDMDGTILDSELLHAKALFRTLEHFGVIYKNPNELMEQYIGQSDLAVYKDLANKSILNSAINLEIFLKYKNKFILEMINLNDCKDCLIDGMITFLEETSKHFKICLVTASEKEVAQALLKKLDLIKYFQFVLTRNDTEKTKPDPAPYLKAFEKLKLKAQNTLIFEDSLTGIQSAVSSGANVIEVLWYKK